MESGKSTKGSLRTVALVAVFDVVMAGVAMAASWPYFNPFILFGVALLGLLVSAALYGLYRLYPPSPNPAQAAGESGSSQRSSFPTRLAQLWLSLGVAAIIALIVSLILNAVM